MVFPMTFGVGACLKIIILGLHIGINTCLGGVGKTFDQSMQKSK